MLFSLFMLFSFAWAFQFAYAKLSGRRIKYTRLANCGLLEISGSADDCAEASGGLAESYVADCDDLDLDAATIDADGNIIDIPWLTGATPYVRFSPDDNDEAYFNQEATRDDNGKITIVQTAFYSFTGINTAKVLAARSMKACCCLIVVHKLNTGFIFIQGLRTKKDAVTGIWSVVKSTKKAKATPSILSQTGADSDRINLEIVSTDSCFAATVFQGQILPTVIPATTVASLVNVN